MPVRYTVPETPFDAVKSWQDDKLFNLEAQANSLTSLVTNINEPLMIGFDGDWGAGKSTFLRRWKYLSENVQAEPRQKQGSPKSFTVVYFDAFEHDYLDDPFVAFAYEVSNQVGHGSNKEVKTAIKTIMKLGTKIIANYFTSGIAGDTTDNLFERQEGQKEKVKNFKEKLKKVAKNLGSLVIVVDELDRCKPDFALNMLEHIKHLFNVENVHFILGYNRHALEEIIKTRYGANINAQRYLDKFITVKMTHMPKEIFVGYSVAQYFRVKFDEMGLSEHKGIIQNYARDIGEGLIKLHKPSLRDINRILTDLALMSIPNENHSYIEDLRLRFITILKIMRWINRDLYNQVRQHGNYSASIPEADKVRNGIIAWLNNYDPLLVDDDEKKKTKSAVQYFLDYLECKKTNPDSTLEHNHTLIGVYMRFEEDIFSEIEQVTGVKSESIS